MARLDIFAVPGVLDTSGRKPAMRPDLEFVEGAAWVSRYHRESNTFYVAVRPENVVGGPGPAIQSKKARRAEIDTAFGPGATDDLLVKLSIGEDRPDDDSVQTIR